MIRVWQNQVEKRFLWRPCIIPTDTLDLYWNRVDPTELLNFLKSVLVVRRAFLLASELVLHDRWNQIELVLYGLRALVGVSDL